MFPDLPLVSVICVSNRPKFIAGMLTMFYAQTWPHKELVLIDSSPGGAGIEIALSFGDWMKRSPLTDESHQEYLTRFEYEQVNEGARVALMRNHGMSIATGEYMTWMDDDGWHDPHRIEELMLKMDAEEIDALGVQGIYWCDAVNPVGVMHYVGTKGFPMFGSMVFHRRCFEKHSFDGGHFGVSHGLNLSNPKMPQLNIPCDKVIEDFYGDAPYGLKRHLERVKNAVKGGR